MTDSSPQPNNPLHGVTLRALLEDLVARHGWEALGQRTQLRCFLYEPSLTSSLRFLRKNLWAREKVEGIYIEDHRRIARNQARNKRRAARRAYAAKVAAEVAALVPAAQGEAERDDSPRSG